jgi:hypothetical protein
VSAALGRVVWIVGASGADRFAAADATQPTRHVDVAGDAVAAVCAVEPACTAVAVAAPVVATPPPKRPLYRRAALWVPLAVGVALVVTAGVLAGTLSNASSDYVVRVH